MNDVFMEDGTLLQRSYNSLREQFKKKRIGVLMGGMSAEREISLKTGEAIITALHKQSYQAIPIDVDENIVDNLRKHKIDVCFIALHGLLGEDGAIEGLLEVLRIPYTGSDILASALCMNKVAAKKIFFYHKLPTPRFQSFIVRNGQEDEIARQITLSFPVVIKPSEEGSTIGVSLVQKRQDCLEALKKVAQYGKEALIEEYVFGREVTVGILDGFALPPVEISPKNGFYDYLSKYTKGATEYIIPARLGKKGLSIVKRLASRAFSVLGCSGVARVDFMVDEQGRPFILEVNTVPGMTETSLLPMAGKEAGIDFPELAERILLGASLHRGYFHNSSQIIG